MPQRQATATWEGDLKQGQGRMRLGSGAFEGAFSFRTRMGDEAGTNPEELVGAALAGCFSMALADGLAQAGAPPARVETTARVHFDQGGGDWAISGIDLTTEVAAPGVSEADFQAIAADTKANCPVARALTGTAIRLDAKLAAPA